MTLVAHEQRSDRQRTDGGRDGGGQAPVLWRQRHREQRQPDGRREQGDPPRVDPAGRCEIPTARKEGRRRGDAHQAGRHVDQEQQPPAPCLEQEPAQRRTHRQADRLRRGLEADHPAQPIARGDRRDQRDAVGLYQRRTSRLDDAEQAQDGEIRRQPAGSAGNREDRKAADVERLASDCVGPRTYRNHQRDEGQHVGERHPLDRAKSGVEVR